MTQVVTSATASPTREPAESVISYYYWIVSPTSLAVLAGVGPWTFQPFLYPAALTLLRDARRVGVDKTSDQARRTASVTLNLFKIRYYTIDPALYSNSKYERRIRIPKQIKSSKVILMI